MFVFFSSRRRHTRFKCDWSSDVCSSDLGIGAESLTVFVLGNVNGLHEGLGQVGDGPGSPGFYIAANNGGGGGTQNGTEIASGGGGAGEGGGKVFSRALRGPGAGFFFGGGGPEGGMLAGGRG